MKKIQGIILCCAAFAGSMLARAYEEAFVGSDFGLTLDTYFWYQEQPVVSRTARLSHYCTYADFIAEAPYRFDRVTYGHVPVYEGIANNTAASVKVLTLAFRRLYSIKRERNPIYIVYDGSSYVDVSEEDFVSRCTEWLMHGGVSDYRSYVNYYCNDLVYRKPRGEAPVPLKRMCDQVEEACELTLEVTDNHTDEVIQHYEHHDEEDMPPSMLMESEINVFDP